MIVFVLRLGLFPSFTASTTTRQTHKYLISSSHQGDRGLNRSERLITHTGYSSLSSEDSLLLIKLLPDLEFPRFGPRKIKYDFASRMIGLMVIIWFYLALSLTEQFSCNNWATPLSSELPTEEVSQSAAEPPGLQSLSPTHPASLAISPLLCPAPSYSGNEPVKFS